MDRSAEPEAGDSSRLQYRPPDFHLRLQHPLRSLPFNLLSDPGDGYRVVFVPEGGDRDEPRFSSAMADDPNSAKPEIGDLWDIFF
jgi:hypothetical protein